VPKLSLMKRLPRGHLIHVAASRSMRCSVLALARLRFVGHTASHLRAAPVKSPLLYSDTVARAPLSVHRHMRRRSSHARRAIVEQPFAHHSSHTCASHQRTTVKTGERKREMRLGFHPPSRHAVLSVRETLSAVHLGSMAQIVPLQYVGPLPRPASPRPIWEGSTA
jgi:hypothetical protein